MFSLSLFYLSALYPASISSVNFPFLSLYFPYPSKPPGKRLREVESRPFPPLPPYLFFLSFPIYLS
jgi:hypothetical protein